MWEYNAVEHIVWVVIHVLFDSLTSGVEIAVERSINPLFEITAHIISGIVVGSLGSVDGEAPFEAGVLGIGLVGTCVFLNDVLVIIAVSVSRP